MFERDDEKYLINQLNDQKVVLFLGSGFSLQAKNLREEKFPTGRVLGEKLWKFLKYEEEYGSYDGTSLTDMYQAFLADEETDRTVKCEFLNKHLTSSEIPAIYDAITKAKWRRIYSTNIDDIIEKTYKRNNVPLEELRYPADNFPGEDPHPEMTRVIYLHGKLPCQPEEVVFSPQQYAKAQFVHEPLYEQFVKDYAASPTVFIGTALNDPLFERYIVARQTDLDVKEERPASFLITPSISPVKADNLRKSYNVYHVKGKTGDFLNWLEFIAPKLIEKNKIH